MGIHIRPTAEVSDKAQIREGSSVWHHAQVREDVRIGRNCIIGKGVYVDVGVLIGDNVKIQNYVYLYRGVPPCGTVPGSYPGRGRGCGFSAAPRGPDALHHWD